MRKIIVANWKMNLSSKNALSFFEQINKGQAAKNKKINLIICPSFTALSSIKNLVQNSKLKIPIGAQNCFWEESGAYTGEISPKDLKELGCEYVILGHSERRRYFQETNEKINKKIKAALKVGLTPIFCLGETKGERQGGLIEETIKSQLKEGLAGVKAAAKQKMIIAYEPVWAIGTREACSPGEAVRVHHLIKKETRDIMGGGSFPVLYGGSVNGKNIGDYLEKEEVDGVLVGSASVRKEFFSELFDKKAII